jgi:gingipain R
MKNYLVLPFFILAQFFVFSQTFSINKNTLEEVQVDFTFKELPFKYRSLNNEKFLDFSIDGNFTLFEKDAPSLPFYTKSVLIPAKGNTDLVVSYDGVVEYQNVSVIPSLGLLKKRDSLVTYFFGDSYKKDSYYPGKLASITQPFILRELRGQTIQLFPYQYNPITRTLRFYKNLRVSLRFLNSAGVNELEYQINSTLGRQFFENQFINRSNIKEKYLSKDENGEMLVICPKAMLTRIKPLVDWKNQKGIKTSIGIMEDIGKTAGELKDFISNYYSKNASLLYLLLVGDYSDVPTYTYGNFYGDEYWSDSYYGQLSGNDFYSELFVGRFSGDSLEVSTMVNRTLEYEKNPLKGDWMTRAIGIGSSQGLGIGDNGESDWQHERVIRTNLLATDYSYVYEFYDGNQGVEDAVGNPTNVDVISALDSGVGLLNYTGHGDTRNFVTSNFYDTDVLNAQNFGAYPFVISVACNNGKFVGNKCISETWLSATKSNRITGAIAACGSSILMDWAPPMKTQDEIVRLLSDSSPSVHKSTLGGLFNNGQFSMLEKYGTSGEDVIQTWVFFGDPSTLFRNQLTKPIFFSLEPNDSEIKIKSLIEGLSIGISENNVLIASGKIVNGSYSFPIPTSQKVDTFLITATMQNYGVSQELGVCVNGQLVDYEKKSLELNIYPNPSKNHIVIASSTNFELDVYTLEGKKIDVPFSDVFNLDISQLPVGSYLLHFTFKDKVIVKKIDVIR